MIAGATSSEEFSTLLRNLELPLQATLRDLRSQVVREACITIAFLSQSIGIKFDHAAECLLTPLINLIQNSAKVRQIIFNEITIFNADCNISCKILF